MTLRLYLSLTPSIFHRFACHKSHSRFVFVILDNKIAPFVEHEMRLLSKVLWILSTCMECGARVCIYYSTFIHQHHITL